MKKPIVALALALAVAGSIRGARAAEEPTAAIQALLGRLEAAFNKSDPEAFLATWDEAGTLINPAGTVGTGRDGLRKLITQDMATVLRGTTSRLQLESVHLLRPDLAFVDFTQALEGGRTPDGQPAPAVKLHVAAVAVKRHGGWAFREARPYAFLAPPPAR
jgi:uncharacterized protein (TIGR02246 family)